MGRKKDNTKIGVRKYKKFSNIRVKYIQDYVKQCKIAESRNM